MRHPCRQTLPAQSFQMGPLLPLFMSTLHIQSASVSARWGPSLLCSRAASSTGPPSSSPSERRVGGILLPLSVVPRFPIAPTGKPKGAPVPRPRPSLRPHLLPPSLLLTMFQPCQPARWAWNKPIISSAGCFVLLPPPYSSFWGKSLRDLCIMLISVESGLSSNLSFSETLFWTLYLVKLSVYSVFLPRLSFLDQYIRSISQYQSLQKQNQ